MIEDLQLVILNGTHCSPEFLPYYQKAYTHWKKMWQSTFQELEGQSEIHSDNFSRQNEILAFFCKDQCLAMVCHRYVDLHLPSLMDDTYFASWPKKTMSELQGLKGRIAIGNQISIDPQFRKLPHDRSMKEVLLWLSLNRLKSQEIDFIIGTVREDKSLDLLFQKFGAKILQSHVPLHKVPVALVCFQREQIDLLKTTLPLSWLSQVYAKRQEDPHCFRELINPQQWRAA